MGKTIMAAAVALDRFIADDHDAGQRVRRRRRGASRESGSALSR
jgi:hypothetical protein